MLEALGASACGPLVRGERAPADIPDAVRLAVEARRFLADVRAGTRGLSRDGRLFAMEWKGAVLVGGIVLAGRVPLICIGSLDDLRPGSAALEAVSLMGLGG